MYKNFGHAAAPWRTWADLYSLEMADNRPNAAADARQEAIQAVLAYRRDGGLNSSANLYDFVFQAIQRDNSDQTALDFALLANDALFAHDATSKILFPKLQAILRGSRDPALADDPELPMEHAAELLLLLECLDNPEYARKAYPPGSAPVAFH